MKKLLAGLAMVVTAGLAVTGPATAAFGATGAGGATAATLGDCLAAHHVCVAWDARSSLSESQQDQLERQIGSDPIYVVVAASGTSGGYNAAMDQIIGDLNSHNQFAVGFWDVRTNHFGAELRPLGFVEGAGEVLFVGVAQVLIGEGSRRAEYAAAVNSIAHGERAIRIERIRHADQQADIFGEL